MANTTTPIVMPEGHELSAEDLHSVGIDPYGRRDDSIQPVGLWAMLCFFVIALLHPRG